MKIEVKIVYVDPAGKVRMSPTGWPEEPKEKDFSGDQWKENDAMQRYNKALKKAKEESIPFEDRQHALTLIYSTHGIEDGRPVNYFYWLEKLKPGFYTIEPIQVELQHQFWNAFKEWQNCNEQSYRHLVSLGAKEDKVRIVARIVTEEEKPAFKTWRTKAEHDASGNPFLRHLVDIVWGDAHEDQGVPATSHSDMLIGRAMAAYPDLFPQFQQPAPVVDKPDAIEQFLKERIAHAYKAIEFPGGMASQQYPFDEHNKDGLIGMKRAYSDVLTSLPELRQLHQQPTEWIPVQQSQFSNSAIGSHHWAATLLSYVMRVGEYMNKHGVEGDKDIYYRDWGRGIKERATEINNYLQSLPEPPKP